MAKQIWPVGPPKADITFRDIGLRAREIDPDAWARPMHCRLPDFKELADRREKALIEAQTQLDAL